MNEIYHFLTRQIIKKHHVDHFTVFFAIGLTITIAKPMFTYIVLRIKLTHPS